MNSPLRIVIDGRNFEGLDIKIPVTEERPAVSARLEKLVVIVPCKLSSKDGAQMYVALYQELVHHTVVDATVFTEIHNIVVN